VVPPLARTRNVLAVIAVVIFVVIDPMIHYTVLGATDLLELRPAGYSAADVKALLTHLGPSGRSWYVVFQAVDFAFIAAATGAMLLTCEQALERLGSGRLLRLALALPVVYAATDAAENVALLVMIRAYPDALDVTRIASSLTIAKFRLFFGAFLLTCALGLLDRRRR
jgi:hypothetical protein